MWTWKGGKLSWKLYRELFPNFIAITLLWVFLESLWQCLNYCLRLSYTRWVHVCRRLINLYASFWSCTRSLSSFIMLDSCYFAITAVYSVTILEKFVTIFLSFYIFLDSSLWRTIFPPNKEVHLTFDTMYRLSASSAHSWYLHVTFK